MRKKSSKTTKHARAMLRTLRIIDFIILVFPVAFYTIMAYIDNAIGGQRKVILTALMGLALIICIFNLFAQKHKRSPIWLVFMGIYYAMESVIPLVIMCGVGAVLDDFVFAPAISYFKTSLIANKQIDKRLGVENE